jgi:hypothetical protein
MAIDTTALRTETDKLKAGTSNNYLENFVALPDKPGTIVLRFLPTPTATHGFYFATRTHKINGKNVHCPCTENPATGKFEGSCPICNHYRNLWRKSDSLAPHDAEAIIAEARELKPNPRFYYNCVVRSVTNKDGTTSKNVGPKIFSAGIKLHAKILAAICGDPNLFIDPLGDVTDFSTGRDFAAIKTVERSGRDTFPSWESSKFLGVSKAGTEAEYKQWSNTLHDLTALRRLLSLEELAKELAQHKNPDSKDEATAPQEKAVPSSQVKSQKKRLDDEEVDEDFLAKLRSM